MLGVLVFVHELGHFLVAKKAGIKVEEFSLGYPPKAFGIRYGETEYLISWLPLGGYVKVAGMSDFGKEVGTGEPWEFNSKPRWIQMSVMAAGPAMNFILAFILILGIRIGYGDYAYLQTTRVGVVSESSALYEAGLRLGDRILAIEGNEITAIKNVTIDEPYFQGHFPGHPIMPGVLQLEAMAQVAGILTLKQADSAGKIAYFMSAEKVKWRKPVKPGDVLQIDIKLLKARSKVAKARGVCTVRGEVVSEAEITFSLVDNR